MTIENIAGKKKIYFSESKREALKYFMRKKWEFLFMFLMFKWILYVANHIY